MGHDSEFNIREVPFDKFLNWFKEVLKSLEHRRAILTVDQTLLIEKRKNDRPCSATAGPLS